MPMITALLTNPTVNAAIEALQHGDRAGWSALFEPDAKLYDDGVPRSLKEFTRSALGHERFVSIGRIETTVSASLGISIPTAGASSERTFGFSLRRPERSV